MARIEQAGSDLARMRREQKDIEHRIERNSLEISGKEERSEALQQELGREAALHREAEGLAAHVMLTED